MANRHLLKKRVVEMKNSSTKKIDRPDYSSAAASNSISMAQLISVLRYIGKSIAAAILSINRFGDGSNCEWYARTN